MKRFARRGGFCSFLSGCILLVSGCGDAGALKVPSHFSHYVSMSPADFGFTGFSGRPHAGAPEDPVGFVREALYHSRGYREARQIMAANGPDEFSSMIMLYIGGDEHTSLIWAFKHRGTVGCLTSLYADRLTAHASTHEKPGVRLCTRVDLSGEVYEQGLSALFKQASKGDYTVGSTETLHHGSWVHVVAYDRDRGWFLRATVVDPDVLEALDFVVGLGAFAPGQSRCDVIGKARQMLVAVDDLPDLKEDANELFGEKIDVPDIKETGWRELLKRVDQNWDKCLPVLVAMQFVWPGPFPVPGN